MHAIHLSLPPTLAHKNVDRASQLAEKRRKNIIWVCLLDFDCFNRRLAAAEGSDVGAKEAATASL